MGLLDDAIREHLELRRRQGADAGEVARLEQEALGPVVRGESPAPELLGDPAVEEPLPEPTSEAAPAMPEQIEGQQTLDDAVAPVEEPWEQTQPSEPPPVAEPIHAQQPPIAEAAAPAEPPAAPEQVVPEHSREPAAALEPPVPPAGAGQPTEEYDVDAVHAAIEQHEQHGVPHEEAAPPAAPHEEHAPAAPPGEGKKAGEGEDMLEQTPEFLQETPEHDRLWFEQAPPKDFDFDR